VLIIIIIIVILRNPYNERLFVYVTSRHRAFLRSWQRKASRQGHDLTVSEIVRFALDQISKRDYADAAEQLRERRGRPPTHPRPPHPPG
jgi:hypothetical protein